MTAFGSDSPFRPSNCQVYGDGSPSQAGGAGAGTDGYFERHCARAILLLGAPGRRAGLRVDFGVPRLTCNAGCPQVEFGLPDLESRTQIFQIHTRTMNVERDIRFELLARSVHVRV